MREGLETQTQTVKLMKSDHLAAEWRKIMMMTNLERLDEGPQQVTDALRTVQQLDKTHDTEESEERDGD